MGLHEDEFGPRALEAVDRWRAADTIGNLTEIAGYRYVGDGIERRSEPLVFDDNKALWSAILDGREVTENRRVELRSFWLTEWAPLRPGRFHTRDAKFAREMAMEYSQIRADDPEAPRGLRSAASSRGRAHTRIFDPHGKIRMVDGGVGCVRLKSLPNRSTHRWAFGASSSGIVHEGALVAVRDDDHDRLIADIRRYGGLLVTIYGRLRFVPRDDFTESMFGRGIPQLYVEVEAVEPDLHRARRKRLDVTAAVTFTTRADNYAGLNVSYVTFDAAKHGDLERAVHWLETVYVREAYQGTVVTDFDEQTARFDRARFSLHKLLNGLISQADVTTLDDELGLDGGLMDALIKRGVIISGDVHGDVYVAGQVGAMGRNASIRDSDVTINRGPAR